MRRDAYGLTEDGFGLIGGRNYLSGMKISTFTNSAGTSIRLSGSEAWVSVQKIERNSTNSAARSVVVDSGASIIANIQQFSDIQSNRFPQIYNAGLIDLSGSSYIGAASFLHADVNSVNRLRGLHIDTSSGTQPALIVKTTNIIATGSYFRSAATTNAIAFLDAGTNADIYPAMPFCFLANTNTDTDFVAGLTPLTITNWSYSTSKDFGVNTTLGMVTNQIPGFYEINGWQEASLNPTADVNYFNLIIYRNGVALNLRHGSSGTIMTQNILVESIPTTFPTPQPSYLASQSPIIATETVFLRAGDVLTFRLGASDSDAACYLYSGRVVIKHL